MGSAINGLQETAFGHARRALNLCVQAQQVLISGNSSPEAAAAALELNRRAREESKRAMNLMEFLRRCGAAEK